MHGLSVGEDSPLNAPPYSGCLPWNPSASASGARRKHSRQRARLPYLLGSAPPGGHGFGAFGPVSEEAGERQYLRFRECADSIRRSGYREEAPIRVELLWRGGDWRGRILDGSHRCAALVALGYERVPAVLARGAVRRSDAGRWPGVRSGMYTTSQALDVFDRWFDGNLPESFPRWP